MCSKNVPKLIFGANFDQDMCIYRVARNYQSSTTAAEKLFLCTPPWINFCNFYSGTFSDSVLFYILVSTKKLNLLHSLLRSKTNYFPVPSAAELKEKQIRMALDVAIAVGVTIIVILVLAILANLVRRKDPNIGINSDPNAMESGSETSSYLGYSAEHLKLMEVIGESRRIFCPSTTQLFRPGFLQVRAAMDVYGEEPWGRKKLPLKSSQAIIVTFSSMKETSILYLSWSTLPFSHILVSF
jgi:hypothetical protein